MSSVARYAQDEIDKIPGLESAVKIVNTLPESFFSPDELVIKEKMCAILQRIFQDEIQHSERMKSFLIK